MLCYYNKQNAKICIVRKSESYMSNLEHSNDASPYLY